MKKGRNTCTIHVSRFYWYLSIFLVLISLFWGYVNSWTMEIIFLWSVVIELRRPFDFMDWSSKTIHRKLWSTNTSIDETKVLILKKKNLYQFLEKIRRKAYIGWWNNGQTRARRGTRTENKGQRTGMEF